MMKSMKLWQSALVAGVGSVLVNLVLLLVLRPATGVPATFTTVSPGPVIMWLSVPLSAPSLNPLGVASVRGDA